MIVIQVDNLTRRGVGNRGSHEVVKRRRTFCISNRRVRQSANPPINDSKCLEIQLPPNHVRINDQAPLGAPEPLSTAWNFLTITTTPITWTITSPTVHTTQQQLSVI